MMGNQEKKYLWKNTLGSQKGLSFLKFKEKKHISEKRLNTETRKKWKTKN